MENIEEKALDYSIEVTCGNTLKGKDIYNAFKSGYDICKQEYKEKLRWIPIKERLPEIGDTLLVKNKDGDVKIGTYIINTFIIDTSIESKRVVSWRKLEID